MTSTSPFSAIDPALGYLYQVRFGLLWALKRLRQDQVFQVSIEILDDIAFESAGEPSLVLQTKHHLTRKANLTDSSPDLWKTFRVWIEGAQSGLIPPNSSLQLITTGLVPANSVAKYLQHGDRDVERAKSLLDSVAKTSTNTTNKPAYQAYLSLGHGEVTALLQRVFIVDSAPNINDLDTELISEVFWAVDRTHQRSFVTRLEGWWLRRVIGQLTGGPDARISSYEIEAEMADLRDQFNQDALPIDEDLLDFTLDPTIENAHLQHRFVKQLEIINAGKRRIANAIRDYYRAYEQRSRWVREDLVVSHDIRRYEKRLIEEWEIIFNSICDEIGDSATKEAKETAARSVLQWAERASIPIRSNVTEPFLCRGSFHMISDDGRIGWHPDFKILLESILNRSAA